MLQTNFRPYDKVNTLMQTSVSRLSCKSIQNFKDIKSLNFSSLFLFFPDFFPKIIRTNNILYIVNFWEISMNFFGKDSQLKNGALFLIVVKLIYNFEVMMLYQQDVTITIWEKRRVL